MKIDFGQILIRAWQITWKNKSLWVFSFFIVLVSETASGGSNSINLQNRISGMDLSGNSEFLPPEIRNFLEWVNAIDWSSAWVYAAIAAGCVLVVWILLNLLAVRGHGALIAGIRKADTGESVTVREAWSMGGRYFGRLLAVTIMDFLVRLAMAVVAFLVIFGALMLGMHRFLYGGRDFPGVILIPLLLICPVYCGVFTAATLLSLYFYFAKLAIVIEDLGIRASIRRSWKVILRSLGPLMIIGLIVFALSLGMGVVSVLWTAPAIGVFLAGIWPMVQELGMLNMPLLYLSGALFLLSLPVGWLVSAVWVSWTNAVYTLIYMRLTAEATAPPDST
ncbi:MAG: hypothetical protein JW748_08055 [Anaerolineales bacterium]|nr:hypothetical protein [Anaerolineales bacterium]